MKNTFGRNGLDRHSAKTKNYDIGDEVEVEEMKEIQNRVRGRLLNGDWITIIDRSRPKIYAKLLKEKKGALKPNLVKLFYLRKYSFVNTPTNSTSYFFTNATTNRL